jgi:hypothetical protein
MAINRYMNRRPFQGSLYAPPVDTITAALEMAQQQYNTNFAAAEELRNRYIDSLSQDRARADEKQAEYDSRIDEVVAKYNGDYSQATKDLYSLTKQIEKDFNPGGEAWAIQQSKIAWTEATKRNQERLKNGKITAPQMNLLENWMKTTYTGTKKQEDGTYSILEVPELVDYVKAEDIAAKAAKEVPKRTRVTTEPVYRNGRWFTDYKKDEYIDPKDMEQAISSALVQDDKYVQYVSQMSALTGIGFDEILGSSVKTFSERFVNTHAGTLYDEDSVNYKGVDALYLESVKQRNRKDMEDYKNKQAAEAGMNTQLSLLGVAGRGGKFKEVNLEGELHFDPKSPMYYSRYLPTIDEAMQRSDEFNIQILAELSRSMPKASLRDVWDAYNRSIKLDNYSKGVYYHKFETTAAQNEEADRMLPRLKAGAAKAYVLNTDTGRVEPATDREIRAFYNDNYDPVKRKAITAALGKTSPQTGNVPFGTVFPTSSGNGYFIIAENEERMNQFNENTRHAAFSWIQTNAIDGPPFDIVTEKGPMTISGHKMHRYNEALGAVVSDVEYYQVVDKDLGNGRHVQALSPTPLTYNGITWTPAHVEQALIGSSMSDYNPKRPKTATKEYNNTIE